ncbi:type IX secretion system membrane protein PorP/SprF [Pedobacter sp. BS3]|uniref:PorP/SprF family type IX secretion system membrane protein n=1 Tax=Pedobacter sp. BS3 TaxID=2567937 RepID=UPI0011F052A5|nr:PorP/SprF family type IX secretion system membrane protein [Pedobacter sp. BS3]TZF83283.1 type IX secretion system membrane protein PorP/SprF [Pedobacter sp. BS3]
MKQRYNYLLTCLAAVFLCSPVVAQVNPLSSMYYQNQYLGNPALAGTEEGLNANLVYRKQFMQVPGSPSSQAFTGEYGFNKRVGAGLNINFSKSGLINYARVVATYAYHLPLTDNQTMHFGLSLGAAKAYINNREITGGSYDPAADRYNDRGAQLDGDFGLAYTGHQLTLQGAIINIGNYLQTDPNRITGINYATFFTAAAYRYDINEQMAAEPKVAYRGIKGVDDIIDAGVKLSYQDKFSLTGLYHTTKNATFGFGIDYNNRLAITGMYTTNTADMQGYTSGDFEIGLNLKLTKKRTNH